ncbi:protein ZAR1-like [Paramormyrops kingsleyae]|uniref:Zygote arrest 1-like n=1 Tax=Paramormyrops kingsleyae TaxID=1676925 RepID=A0A3B3T7P8_9TELE|nr:ZAR1-like protein [Paramormyrops kingsleyae]
MEGFMFSPHNFNMYTGGSPYAFNNQKTKYQHWNKKGSLYMPPEAMDYLDFCKRAQLRAILSQVNPNLTPRLRKANTKEFGVQVNPKVDAVVQCSLGPKTLFYRDRKWFSSKVPQTPENREKFMPSTPINVRFSRPVAIYSPVFDRRFFTVPENSVDEPSQLDETKKDRGDKAKVEAAVKERVVEEAFGPESRHSALDPTQVPKKFNFQFLEQKYGFFHCSQCNIRWESAYVWCISGTNKVYFKQYCRKCQVGFNPYRVESIQCQGCGQTRCSCERKQRHIDMARPHRQDLCGRCRGKRLSCDSTYSFKYIV